MAHRLARLHAVALMISIVGVTTGVADEAPAVRSDDGSWRHSGYPPAVSRLMDDLVVVSTVPLRWQRTEWQRFAVLAGVTLGLAAVDEDIQRWSQKGRLSLWDPAYDGGVREDLIELGGWLGDAETVAGISALLYASGRLAGQPHLQETGQLAFESLIVTTLVVELIKRLVDRQRPSGRGVDHAWGPRYTASSGHSFPSGHAAAAFALARVLARQYPESGWVAPLAYSLATLTAVSRVAENRHWTSDVVVGACLGMLISDTIVQRHRERTFRVLPHVGPNGAGVTVSWRF